MQFVISDSFTSSLGKLATEEQKAVKTAAFDLQLNPANPGFSFHKLDRAKDKQFWSVRVGSDIRIIVHGTDSSFMLCYVDHHDNAYAWAERHKFSVHPITGAAQLVEVIEKQEFIKVPVFIQEETKKALPSEPEPVLVFKYVSDESLLGYGVPTDWLDAVKLTTEDGLYQLVDHLHEEAAEALILIATGGTPAIREVQPIQPEANPFAHPDAQRRFRVMTNLEELRLALEFPWDKWMIYLHPAQKQLVERQYHGPARVSGSAGTGKTIVALHRAVFWHAKTPIQECCLPHTPIFWPMP